VIAALTLAILIPSTYTAWAVVREERFRQAARRFVADQLTFPDRAVLDVNLGYSSQGSVVRATILGPALPAETVRSLEARLPSYGLAGTRLDLRQPEAGLASVEQIVKSVRQNVLDDLSQRNDEAVVQREKRIRDLEGEVVRLRSYEFPVREITSEISALYPGLVSLGVGQEITVDEASQNATLRPVVVACWKKMPPRQDQIRLRSFCSKRLGAEALRLVNTLDR
jgi:hypothetical protein